MENHLITNIVLEAEQTDLWGRWRIDAILRAMQTAADRHANSLAVGLEQAAGHGACWVIARLRVDMVRYPRYLDPVSITTWPGQPDRLAFPRYFHFRDGSGSLLGRATSLYMLLDLHTHTPIPPHTIALYEGLSFRPETNERPVKLRFGSEINRTVTRTPAYSDIDINGHMNNTRYAEWVCNLFPSSRFERDGLCNFQLNYLSNGMEGQPIVMYVSESDMGFMVRGADAATGTAVFAAAGEFLSEV